MFKVNKRPVHLTSQPSQRGFTLLELLVVISIIAIIVALAAPNISHALERQRNKEAAQSIASAFKEARTESFLRKQMVRVKLEANQISLQTADSTDKKINSYPINKTTPVTPSTAQIDFYPNKRVSAATTYVIACNADGKKGRSVVLDANGNVSVSTVGSLC